MATVMPKNQLLRQAVRYIDEERKESNRTLQELVDECSMRFNLGPKDSLFLIKYFTNPEDAVEPA